MKTSLRIVLLTSSFLLHPSSFLLAQGSLTPPGAPAPTMKTLDQIEPRTPISTVPFSINTSGSYYLTGNLAVGTGGSNAITINADHVTLDLNGFTLSSTASPASGSGVFLSGPRTNVAIKNGNIRGTTTVSAGVFTTGGFSNGIFQGTGSGGNQTVEDVRVSGVGNSGIFLINAAGEVGTFSVGRCSVTVCGGPGIQADNLRDCVVNSAGQTAMFGRILSNCFGECVGFGAGISGALVVENSRGISVGSAGISGGVVLNCQGVSVSGAGINAGQASNSSGFSTSGNGLSAVENVTNCSGTSTSGPFGMNVNGTASFCRGQRDGGIAIQAGLAISCTVDGTGTITSLAQSDPHVPQIPITTLPRVLSQPGSYCLAKSFVQDFSVLDAITITTDNVTVDFCGYTITQTGTSGTIAGVRLGSGVLNVPVRNVVIKNGAISGFGGGVTAQGGRNCLIENLSVTRCGGGISFQALGTAGAVGNTFRRCKTNDNTGSGIVILSGAANVGNVIENCESLNNSTGFALAGGGNLIIGCRASGNSGFNYTIAAGNRGGTIILPTASGAPFNGSTGALGSGTTDPFANLSY